MTQMMNSQEQTEGTEFFSSDLLPCLSGLLLKHLSVTIRVICG